MDVVYAIEKCFIEMKRLWAAAAAADIAVVVVVVDVVVILIVVFIVQCSYTYFHIQFPFIS